MSTQRAKNSSRSAGKSLVEFLLVAPVLLLIGGATIEIANYMRVMQIVTVMSQDVANRAYRQCADITLVDNPALVSVNDPDDPDARVAVRINQVSSSQAVDSCLATINQRAQATLSQLLGAEGTAIHLTVFRDRFDETALGGTVDTETGTIGPCQAELTLVGRAEPRAPSPSESNDDSSGGPNPGSGNSGGDNPPAPRYEDAPDEDDNEDKDEDQHDEEDEDRYDDKGGYSGGGYTGGEDDDPSGAAAAARAYEKKFGRDLQKPSSGGPVNTVSSVTRDDDGWVLVSETDACKRNRVVVSEVSFAYTPTVPFISKLLPGFIMRTNGDLRATTTL